MRLINPEIPRPGPIPQGTRTTRAQGPGLTGSRDWNPAPGITTSGLPASQADNGQEPARPAEIGPTDAEPAACS